MSTRLWYLLIAAVWFTAVVLLWQMNNCSTATPC